MISRAHWENFPCAAFWKFSLRHPVNNELLTCVYSYVPDKLTGLLESLPAVFTVVCKAAAVDVLLVVPGAGRQRPAREETHTEVIHARNAQQLFLNILQLSTYEIKYETLVCRRNKVASG